MTRLGGTWVATNVTTVTLDPLELRREDPDDSGDHPVPQRRRGASHYLGRHRDPDGGRHLLHALGADLRPAHAEDRRLPLLLRVPAALHAGHRHRALAGRAPAE